MLGQIEVLHRAVIWHSCLGGLLYLFDFIQRHTTLVCSITYCNTEVFHPRTNSSVSEYLCTMGLTEAPCVSHSDSGCLYTGFPTGLSWGLLVICKECWKLKHIWAISLWIINNNSHSGFGLKNRFVAPAICKHLQQYIWGLNTVWTVKETNPPWFVPRCAGYCIFQNMFSCVCIFFFQ